MKSTRKQQLSWMESVIIESFDAVGNPGYNPFTAAARDLRCAGGDPVHFLIGVCLSRFPFWNEEQENLLISWGYSPKVAARCAGDMFFIRSASLLVEVLRNHGVLA